MIIYLELRQMRQGRDDTLADHNPLPRTMLRSTGILPHQRRIGTRTGCRGGILLMMSAMDHVPNCNCIAACCIDQLHLHAEAEMRQARRPPKPCNQHPRHILFTDSLVEDADMRLHAVQLTCEVESVHA